MTKQNPRSVPMLDLTGEVEELWEELSSSVLRVLRSGSFVLGGEVAAFEREAAEHLGVEHAIGLNSGTDALVIGLRALGIGPGDEVITTTFSFFATAEAIVNVGATPVFVDVEEESFNIDPRRIEEAVSERTRAILPVHLFGKPAAMSAIAAVAARHDLMVLEDCAQSFGAIYHSDFSGEKSAGEATEDSHLAGRKTGSLGHAAAFSFYPTKNLGAYGDAGLLATDNDEVASLARMLRNHGATPERRYENQMPGYNSRLDEIQAAVLRVKLPRVDEWNQARREVADRYRQSLAGVAGVISPEGTGGHVFHQFTVRIPAGNRDEVQAGLSEAGVATAVFYPVPLHQAIAGAGSGSLPVSERLAGEVLSLPIWPGITSEAQDRVVELLLELASPGGG